MTKDVLYTGLTRQPDDNLSADGTLALCHNLINEDGALRPIPQPRKILSLGDYKILTIHTTPAGDNYILTTRQVEDGSFSLYYTVKTAETHPDILPQVTQIAPGIPLSGYRDISVIGNTLILACDDGLHYILFRDGRYKYLGTKIPTPSIQFALRRSDPAETVPGLKTRGADCILVPEAIKRLLPDDVLNTPADDTTNFNWAYLIGFKEEDLPKTSEAVHGYLNKIINEEIHKRGQFLMPFLIRYAVKLFDGTNTRTSPAVLMLPWVLPPLLEATLPDDGTPNKADKGYTWIKLIRHFEYSQLLYRIIQTPDLDDWKDIITGVELFVSQPIWTYDQSKNFSIYDTLPPVADTYRYLASIAKERDNGNKFLEEYFKALAEDPDGTRGPIIDIPDITPDWSIQSWLDTTVNNGSGSPQHFPEMLFAGHFQNPGPDQDLSRPYKDQSLTAFTSPKSRCINLPFKPDFFKILFSGHSFHRIAVLEPHNVTAMPDFQPLVLETEDLSNISTFPTLNDTANEAQDITPRKLFAFNSRLNACGVTARPTLPSPVRVLTPFSNQSPDGPMVQNISVTVWTRIDGQQCRRSYIPADNAEADALVSPSLNIPRFISVPDSNAFAIEIKCADVIHRFPLKAFDTTPGAYYFAGFGLEPKFGQVIKAPAPEIPQSISLPNRLYLSQIDNPFMFTDSYAVGNGTILDISAACRPLSQGQFGQYPLYVFCTDGTWALATNAEGSYSSVSPVSRDLYNQSSNIAQTDTGVVFPSERGIMLLNGSQLQCISESINCRFPFDPFSLPYLPEAARLFGIRNAQASSLDFRDFIKTSSIHYDYADQRLIFCRRDLSLAFVYSLRSGHWATMDCDFSYSVNAYPQSLAAGDTFLYDFSEPLQQEIPALLVTRPLSLDANAILKTPFQFIQRGIFPPQAVATLLYGTRDYRHWHPLATSRTHRLSHLAGTPWKAFRIAAPMRLRLNENIAGVSANFQTRQTNKLR